MDWQNVYVLALAFSTIVVLALEKAHLATIGISLILAVSVPGLVPEAADAIAGFSNTALVTIAALYIVGEGFMRSGAASILARWILRHTRGSESALVFVVMGVAAVLSAFINNTLVVIAFLPVITSICRATGIYPSRLLIPLSYASILGGMCTLVGTSTNLLVSGALEKMGRPALSMFEMSPPGMILAGVGILYLGLIGRRTLPRIPSLSAQMSPEATREYVMEVTIADGSKLVGEKVAEVAKARGEGKLRLVMVVRKEVTHWPSFGNMKVKAGDILMLTGPIQELTDLQRAEARAGDEDADSYDPATMSFFELALRPDSAWIGRRVGDIGLKARHGAVVVAVQRAGRHIRDRLATMTLHSGDVLLAFGDDRSKDGLRHVSDFHLIEGVDDSIHMTEKAPISFAIILGVVALLVTGVVHYCIAAMIGAIATTATRCLTIRQAHYAVHWPLIFFIAGMLALGRALETTGTTRLLADGIEGALGSLGPYAVLAGVFVGAVVMTEFLSNNAVAVLLAPIAVTVAEVADMNERALVMAVALGASCSFANPIGYQTNLLIYGPGGYRFRDYLKAGLALDLMLSAVGVVAIGMFWPLT